VMIRWTGLAPWEFEFPFPGSLTSTFLRQVDKLKLSLPPHLDVTEIIGSKIISAAAFAV